MKLAMIAEDRATAKPSFRLVPASIEKQISSIDIGEINENHAPLLEIPITLLLSREIEVYIDTVEDYKNDLIKTGHFASPSGDLDEEFFPWGIRFGNMVVIMDGTHRCEAQVAAGARLIKIHVFPSLW